MNCLKRICFAITVLSGILLFSLQAHAVSYALTGFTYDTGAGMVYGTSQTYLDYDLDPYYNAGVDGYLIKYNDPTLSSYTILGSGSQDHQYDAVVLTASNVQRGETYAVFSDHFLQTTLYYYGYPYDPYGISYNYFGEGGGSPYYGFQYWQAVIMQDVWFYLGRTGVIVSLPDITQLAPDAGTPGTTPAVQVLGKYIGEHTQIPPVVSVSGYGVTAQFGNFLPNGVEVYLQIAEDADVGDHTLSLTSDGVLSNSVNFRVGDRTPQITSITPAEGITGEQVAVTISGAGFGVNPQIQIDGVGVNPTITSASSTEIQAIFSIADLTYEGNRNITIKSNGRLGNGFISVSGSSPVSNEVTFGVKTPKVTIPEIGSVEKGAVKTITVQIENAPAQNHVTKFKFNNQPPLTGNCPSDGCKTGEARFVDDGGNDVAEISFPGTGESVVQRQIRIRGWERSSSNKNVKLEARFNDNSDVKKDRSFSVASLEFIEEDNCTGYDEVEFKKTNGLDTKHFYVPINGSNRLKAKVVPSDADGTFKLESTEAAVTISPSVITGNNAQIITVSAGAAANRNPTIKVQADNTDSSTRTAEYLYPEVLPRKEKKVVLHAVTEDNDDVRVTTSGPITADTVCIMSGANGFLDTVADSRDVIDVDPANPAQQVIKAGSNESCNSSVNDDDIAPPSLPNATDLENYLNNTSWGRQSNVYFTVSRGTDFEVNFDLDRDGKLEYLTGGTSPEAVAIRNKSNDADAFDLYYVGTTILDNSQPGGLATGAFAGPANGGNGWFGTQGLTIQIAGHEVGHILGRLTHSPREDIYMLDLMYFKSEPTLNQCRVRNPDWDLVNP